MANLQNSRPSLSEEWSPKGLSEFNLAFLRKLAKRLAVATENLTDIGQILPVKVIGHLNLAARNLSPEPFNQSEHSAALLEYFSERYFVGEKNGQLNSQLNGQLDSKLSKKRKDDSAFAYSLTTPLVINDHDWPGSSAELIKWASQAIEKKAKVRNIGKNAVDKSSLGDSGSSNNYDWLPHIKAIGQSTLATGWAQGLFGHSTQVFTPEKIAEHLAADSFPSNSQLGIRLLDPACGAGHLLIPAAEHWLLQTAGSYRMTGQPGKPGKHEQLQELLSEVITGLDVEPKLLQLCGFAFYLLARDQLSEPCDLPIPRLFLSLSAAGSLTLASDDNSDWQDLEGKTATKLSATSYNQIVMNPPYLSTRIMGDTTANFLKRHYPDSAGDLYTAFIELATSLLAPGGKLSMIVQQSFLSVQRYRAFRLKLLEHCHINSCLTLGLGSFSARPGEKVNSAVLTLERKHSENTASAINSLAKPLIDSSNRTMSIGRMENKNLTTNQIAEKTALATINSISGNPFAFDCPTALANCFKEFPALADIDGIAIVNGLFTCNNKKFVKQDSELSENEKHLYVPYDKGGGQKWYHQTSYRLFWPDHGDSIRQYRKERGQSQALPGEEFYFKAGLTYSYIGTTGFKARLLSENSIFDIASSAIFSNKIDHYYLLGFLNSALAIYLLGVLNPTINFQIGDLRRLPFQTPTAEITDKMSNLVKQAISLMRRWYDNPEGINNREFFETERKIQQDIDTIIYQLYKIDKATETIIKDNEWVLGSRKKLVK